MPIFAKILLFALFMVFLRLPFEARAENRETITWLVWELSPEFIRSGEYAGKGFADEYLSFFISKMPEYDHKIRWTSIRRFHRDSLHSQTCTPHIWKAFHLDKFAYSKAYMLTPPHVAIFPKHFENRFGPEGTVLSLKNLFANEGLSLITPPTYSDQPRYPVLHEHLIPYIGTPQIMEMKHATNEVDLRLLLRGRADFALGYQTTITAQRKDRGLAGEFITYGLSEHREFKDIHVSCFGDDFGKNIVGRINRLMDQKALLRFLSLYEEWNNEDKFFRQAFIKRILN